MDDLILSNLDLAASIGRKYARNWGKYEPECIAEANFQLVVFFHEKLTLYNESAENKEAYLRSSIRRGIHRYFQSNARSEILKARLEKFGLSDLEMIDWLEQFFPDCPDIFQRLREGVDLDDLEGLQRSYRKKLKAISRKRNQRLKNFEKLAEAGLIETKEAA